jgi:hypothetical protein
LDPGRLPSAHNRKGRKCARSAVRGASLAISLAALFVALGGTAFAVSQVGSKQLANGAVTSSKLGRAAVGTRALAGNAVTASAMRG